VSAPASSLVGMTAIDTTEKASSAVGAAAAAAVAVVAEDWRKM